MFSPLFTASGKNSRLGLPVGTDASLNFSQDWEPVLKVNYNTIECNLYNILINSVSPGCVLILQVLRKSAVKKTSTSQKKSSTLPPVQARAPTSRPRPREKASSS